MAEKQANENEAMMQSGGHVRGCDAYKLPRLCESSTNGYENEYNLKVNEDNYTGNSNGHNSVTSFQPPNLLQKSQYFRSFRSASRRFFGVGGAAPNNTNNKRSTGKGDKLDQHNVKKSFTANLAENNSANHKNGKTFILIYTL